MRGIYIIELVRAITALESALSLLAIRELSYSISVRNNSVNARTYRISVHFNWISTQTTYLSSFTMPDFSKIVFAYNISAQYLFQF